MLVGGHGGHVKLEVLGYERPSADNDDDANWLSCVASVRVGAFSGASRVSLTTHDFVGFEAGLRSMLDSLRGGASFQPREDMFVLNLEMQTGGTSRVSGRLDSDHLASARLTFSIDSDQSYLASTLAAVTAIVRAFPPVAR